MHQHCHRPQRLCCLQHFSYKRFHLEQSTIHCGLRRRMSTYTAGTCEEDSIACGHGVVLPPGSDSRQGRPPCR